MPGAGWHVLSVDLLIVLSQLGGIARAKDEGYK